VIVDDLRFNHEAPQPAVYDELVAEAQRLAALYIGHEEIDAIVADPVAGERIAAAAAAAVNQNVAGA
jgi:hypothetical protein